MPPSLPFGRAVKVLIFSEMLKTNRPIAAICFQERIDGQIVGCPAQPVAREPQGAEPPAQPQPREPQGAEPQPRKQQGTPPQRLSPTPTPEAAGAAGHEPPIKKPELQMELRPGVRITGFEPVTSCLSSKRSKPTELNPRKDCKDRYIFRIIKPPCKEL